MFIIERLEYPKLVLLTSCVTTDLKKHLQILNQKSTKILSYRKKLLWKVQAQLILGKGCYIQGM